MGEQNNNSDKIKFKVKHLNEYHEIVIDRNDARYESKYQHQQLFEQLESITGVPSRYTVRAYIDQSYIYWPDINPKRFRFSFDNQKAFAPDILRRYSRQHDILSLHFRDGERFHLQYGLSYAHNISKHLSMRFTLVKERDVPEEGCGLYFCQSRCTESYFKRLKDLVCNDELNAKITQIVQPLMESGMWAAATANFREFNIQQYLHSECYVYHLRNRQAGHTRQAYLYPRTRG